MNVRLTSDKNRVDAMQMPARQQSSEQLQSDATFRRLLDDLVDVELVVAVGVAKGVRAISHAGGRIIRPGTLRDDTVAGIAYPFGVRARDAAHPLRCLQL